MTPPRPDIGPPRPARARYALAVAVGVGLALACAILHPPPAAAHAMLTSSTPRPDTVLAALPAQVSLSFDEPVEIRSDAVRVYDSAGAQVDNHQAQHAAPGDSTVETGLSHTAATGTFTVAWQVVSADSHPVSGAYTFSVGHPSSHVMPPAGDTRGGGLVPITYGVIRAAGFASLAGLIGSVAFVVGCWPSGWRQPRVRRLTGTAWLLSLLAAVATLFLQGPYAAGQGLGRIFDAHLLSMTLDLRLGRAVLARVAVLLAIGSYLRWSVPALTREPARHRTLAAAGVGLALALTATWSVAGHASTGIQVTAALPFDIVHLIAMSVWLGGLATLLLALWPGRHSNAAAQAVQRFSPTALTCVVLLVATGTYQAWRQVGSWAALAGTEYGLLVISKVSIIAAVLGIAAISRRAVQRWRHANPTAHVLRRSVAVELLGILAVVSVTAALINTEPAREAQAAEPKSMASMPDRTAPPVPTRVPYRTDAGSGSVTITVTPGTAGPNTIRLTLTDPHGMNVDADELDATLRQPSRNIGPLRLTLRRTAAGSYQAHAAVPLPGTWTLDITVRTSAFDETTLTTPLTLN